MVEARSRRQIQRERRQQKTEEELRKEREENRAAEDPSFNERLQERKTNRAAEGSAVIQTPTNSFVAPQVAAPQQGQIQRPVQAAGGIITNNNLLPVNEQAFLSQIQQEQQNLGVSPIQEQFNAEGAEQQPIEGRLERGTERIAEGALFLPAEAGNLIRQGLGNILGIESEKISAADMAETPLGKVLGVTAATAAGVGLVYGATAIIGGAVSAVSAKLAGTLGVSTEAVLGGAGIGLVAFSGLNKDVIIDKILGRKDTGEIQSSINTMGQMASTISGAYKSGGYGNNPQRAIAELNQLDNDLLILEQEIQQAAILDPRVKQSGKYYDILADLQDQRSTIREARADVLIATPTFDPASIVTILDQIDEITNEKREDLIKRGRLRRTL